MVMFNPEQSGQILSQNLSGNASRDVPTPEADAAMQDMMSLINALRAAGR